jgi:hypothetical protein
VATLKAAEEPMFPAAPNMDIFIDHLRDAIIKIRQRSFLFPYCRICVPGL